MEQGHGRVTDVIGRQLIDLGHLGTYEGEVTLRPTNGLRLACCGPRREDQGEWRRLVDLDGDVIEPGPCPRSQAPRPGRAVHRRPPGHPRPGNRGRPACRTNPGLVSDHELAIGVTDVAGQLGAPSGGVDPDDDRTGEGAAPSHIEYSGTASSSTPT